MSKCNSKPVPLPLSGQPENLCMGIPSLLHDFIGFQDLPHLGRQILH
jgi:hypothetical protein